MDDITKNNQGPSRGRDDGGSTASKKATQYAAKCVCVYIYIYIYIDLQTSADMLQDVAHCV